MIWFKRTRGSSYPNFKILLKRLWDSLPKFLKPKEVKLLPPYIAGVDVATGNDKVVVTKLYECPACRGKGKLSISGMGTMDGDYSCGNCQGSGKVAEYRLSYDPRATPRVTLTKIEDKRNPEAQSC